MTEPKRLGPAGPPAAENSKTLEGGDLFTVPLPRIPKRKNSNGSIGSIASSEVLLTDSLGHLNLSSHDDRDYDLDRESVHSTPSTLGAAGSTLRRPRALDLQSFGSDAGPTPIPAYAIGSFAKKYGGGSGGSVGSLDAFAGGVLTGGGGGLQSPSSRSSMPGTPRRSSTPTRRFDTEEIQNNFKVVVRIRPPLPRELHGERPFVQCVQSKDNRAITISDSPPEGNSNAPFVGHRFTFDYVYTPDAKQSIVYQNTARAAVLSTLQGYNATVLAYGQTGSGKTYTMEGYDNAEQRGIIPRSVEEIFHFIQTTANPSARFLVRASYLQIYNEVISDLLKPERTNLSIREDKKKGVYVEGLSEWVVRSPKEVYGLIKRGSSIRATGSTRMNETSSRSHACFIIIVEQQEVQQSSAEEKVAGAQARQTFRVGKLNLVDLAGSERVRISGASGRRLEESKKINQSLSALGNVISALTDINLRQHIPYRDSKLTRILEDSLGGNCKTTMMAMISPAFEAFAESLSTLKFANRAKNIKNQAHINEDLDEKALLRRYERELKQLRQELAARSQNVVDKRKLLEVEEQRKQAEQDKMQALQNMERLSRDLMVEKAQKKKLEERIKEMSSQLLVGGAEIQDTPEFKSALRQEQERIRKMYSEKVAELEKERENMEEEKGQTQRYKQLLLKQRDIMIQLTARLNERDQSIMLLQEELEAYDRHHRQMEDALDQKTATVIFLQKSLNGTGGDGTGGGGGVADPSRVAELVAADATLDSKLAASAPGASLGNGAASDGGGSGSGDQGMVADGFGRGESKAGGGSGGDLRKQLEEQRSEAARLAKELQDVQADKVQLEAFLLEQFDSRVEAEVAKRMVAAAAAGKDAKGAAPASSSSFSSADAAALVRAERARLEEAHAAQVARLQAELDDRARRLAQLQQQQAQQQQQQAPSDEYRAELQEVQRKYAVQVKERTALKVILEKKMKALVDSIATSTLSGQLPDGALNPRTKREIEVLQQLLNASIVALNHADSAAGAGSASVQSTPAASTPAAVAARPPAAPATPAAAPVAVSRAAPASAMPPASAASVMTPVPQRAGGSSVGAPPLPTLPAVPPSAPAAGSAAGAGGGFAPPPPVPASPAAASLTSIDSIEALIRQRKHELQMLDDRLR